MRKILNINRRQDGLVSLFVVIFSSLLLIILATGFVRLMTQDLSQSVNSDLSMSARDAALAGVEDAKRVLAECEKSGWNWTGNSACRAIAAEKCDTVAKSGIAGNVNDSETIIQTTSGAGANSGQELNQAYTCVKIDPSAPDHKVDINQNQSALIPLNAKADVSKIEISWQLVGDPGNLSQTGVTRPGGAASGMSMYKNTEWRNAPALIQASLANPGSSFTLSDLDANGKSGSVFLYPNSVTANSSASHDVGDALVTRRASDSQAVSNESQAVPCSQTRYAGGDYFCKATISFASPLAANSSTALLRLTAHYRNASARVVLYDAANNIVAFTDGQPVVDSTGRANNLFRRVEARLETGTLKSVAYPENAVDIGGSLCKDFYVTETSSGGDTCRPS